MIDTNDSEFLSRIEDKSLLSKVMPGAAAAAMILSLIHIFSEARTR